MPTTSLLFPGLGPEVEEYDRTSAELADASCAARYSTVLNRVCNRETLPVDVAPFTGPMPLLDIINHATVLYHSMSHLYGTAQDAHDEARSSVFERAAETVEQLRLKLPESLARPRVAVVCGSGLGGLADVVNRGGDDSSSGVDGGTVEFAYKDVLNFPLSTVPGHEGKLIFGTMGPSRVPVVLLVGRAHFYEGHSMETATFATRVCKLLGVQIMLLTNAAGGLNPDFGVGDIMCLNDHINLPGLAGFHPLRGPNADDFGVRFPPLSDAYDISLRQLAHKAWAELRRESPSKRRLQEGVYALASGPTYETRAEARLLRQWGADVVGMSTVPEIIVARHCGMRVMAFSLVTNSVVLSPTVRADDPAVQGLSPTQLDDFLGQGAANHEEVLDEGRRAAVDMQGLILKIVSQL